MQNFIKSPEDLVTSREQTRAGFVGFALEKNRRSTPIIESAKSLKTLALRATTAKELLNISEIQSALLSAAGLSDKALNYFTVEDKKEAVQSLIDNFLEPAGEYFIDELVYRYLLIKGDSLGGSMRNLVGILAQQRLIRTLLSNLTVSNIDYKWCGENKKWQKRPENDFGIEERLKALSWKDRILYFNKNIPIVKNNVDICLFDTEGRVLMLGELKGGIDPAGADEHWKTGNTALDRIRESFAKEGLKIDTSFVAAAIEKKMADEIFAQLSKGTLSCAANLTVEGQLVNYCDWLLKL